MKAILISFVFVMYFIDSLSQDIKLEFIAMQYYAGILNRSYVVQVSDSLIFCGRVQGLISAGVSGRYDKSKLEDPYFYANPNLLETYHNDNVIRPELVELDKANLLIHVTDIQDITYTPKKKWGMGDVIHAGRIFISLKNTKKVELILLGKPDIQNIIDKLKIKI
jgi:hypothetical protein